MNRLSFTRRQLLQGIGGASAALSTASLAATQDPFKRTLDITAPRDALTAMVKMRASLEPEDCPNWYFGTIYGVLPGKTPIPMVDYEGSEIDYFEQQPDGSYRGYAATVSFFRDTYTRKRIETFENPIDFIHKEVLGAWLVWMLIAGHIMAALYHHFVRKDRTLKKMTIDSSEQLNN